MVNNKASYITICELSKEMGIHRVPDFLVEKGEGAGVDAAAALLRLIIIGTCSSCMCSRLVARRRILSSTGDVAAVKGIWLIFQDAVMSGDFLC